MTQQLALSCVLFIANAARDFAGALEQMLRNAGLLPPPKPVSFEGLLDELFEIWPLEPNAHLVEIFEAKEQPLWPQLPLAA